MSIWAVVFSLLVLLDIVIFVFGALVYRIDRSAAETMSNILVLGLILTVCSGLGWFFDTFTMWKP